jgi:transcriptional regulator with XRE-family HTH domain
MAESKWPAIKEKLILVEAWCRDGLTEKDIADKLGISKSTMENYKKEHLDFLNALKRGKEVVDVQVENSLFKRAMGYKYDEVTKENVAIRDEEGKVTGYEMVETKRVTKEVQPDVTAQIFWLKNRKPKEWRDKHDVEHSGEIKMPNIIITK